MAAPLVNERAAVVAAIAALTTAAATAAATPADLTLRAPATAALAAADGAVGAFRAVNLSAEPPGAAGARDAEAVAFEATINLRRATLAQRVPQPAVAPQPLGQQLAAAVAAMRLAAGQVVLNPIDRVAALGPFAALFPLIRILDVPGEVAATAADRRLVIDRVRDEAAAALAAAVAAQQANAVRLAQNLPTRKSAAMTARIEAIGHRFAACVGALADEAAFKTALGELADSLEAIRTLVGRLDDNAATFGVNVANAARTNAATALAATPAARAAAAAAAAAAAQAAAAAAAAAAAVPPRGRVGRAFNYIRGRPRAPGGGGRKALKSMKKRKSVKKTKKTRKNRK